MPRFVLLYHEMPVDSPRDSHWDLMFECRDALSTWACSQLPEAGVIVVAERLAEHRREYLDYEGPVSRKRGSVCRWDEGTFRWIECSDTKWLVQVHGGRLCGDIELTAESRESSNWRCLYTPDRR